MKTQCKCVALFFSYSWITKFSNSGISLWFVKALSAFVYVESRKNNYSTVHEKKISKNSCSRSVPASWSWPLTTEKKHLSKIKIFGVIVEFCTVRATVCRYFERHIRANSEKNSFNTISIMKYIRLSNTKISWLFS